MSPFYIGHFWCSTHFNYLKELYAEWADHHLCAMYTRQSAYACIGWQPARRAEIMHPLRDGPKLNARMKRKWSRHLLHVVCSLSEHTSHVAKHSLSWCIVYCVFACVAFTALFASTLIYSMLIMWMPMRFCIVYCVLQYICAAQAYRVVQTIPLEFYAINK